MLKTWKYWKDVFIGTIFIFVLIYGVVQFLGIFDFLDPVGDALEDVQITDQVFSNPSFRPEPPLDDNVLLVNFGRIDRRGIAQQLNVLNKYNPRVIGIDTFFSSLKEDSIGDMMLADAMANTDNLVLATQLLNPSENANDPYWYDIRGSHPYFTQHAEGQAFATLVDENPGTSQEQLKIVRSFFPNQILRDTINDVETEQIAFGVKLAEFINRDKAQRFLERGLNEEVINYRGNIINFMRQEGKPKFFALDVYDVLDENFDPELIKDKIVIMGHLGENFATRYWIEDKFYTPMNEKYAGRADVDMYGAVIHANIVAMILNEDYINKMSEKASIAIGIFLCFINVMLFTWIYRRLPPWYDGLTKLMQLTELVFLFGVTVYVFNQFSLQIDLTLGIVAIVLAGDSLEVLYGVGYNIFDKEKRKELFTISK